LAGVVRAEEALRVVERGTKGLSFDAAEAVQEAYDARCDAWEEALGRAMLVAAPDWPALASKLVWVVDHEVATLDCGEEAMAALRADAVRLGDSRLSEGPRQSRG
jgi:hypothetical protein